MSAQGLIIPSIFTVIDQVSPALGTMQHNVSAFGTRSEQAIGRASAAFKRLTPGLGAVQSQLLSMVGTGALLAGAFQLGSSSFNSIRDYEASVDSFRVIVSELNDTDFKPFQDKIDSIAKSSGKSGTEVAQAFEKIAGINSSFAGTADGIGKVTTATITLAKASRMELGTAAENLVGIMNQYSFGAEKADRVINALAAGQAVGAANISQTAEAFTIFGAVASANNVTLEQSVGLIQTLGKYSLYGAEAGTKLRGVTMRLQKAGLGYASGQFNINDALRQTNTILSKVTKVKERDMIVNKLFGVENGTAGRILLKNIDTYEKFTSAVTGTQEAQKGAAINSGNLKTALEQLGAGWARILTGSDEAKLAVTDFTSVIHYLTENLGSIVSKAYAAGKAAIYLGGAYLLINTYLKTARIAIGLYNVAIGIQTGLTLGATAALEGSATAMKGVAIGERILAAQTAIVTGNFRALATAFSITPFGLVLTGIAAISAAAIYLAYHQSQLNDQYERQQSLNVTAHISAQSKATQELAKQWERVGYNTHDAIIKALQYQVLQAEQGLSKASAKQSQTESDLFKATDEAWFPAFNSEVSRLRNELNSVKSEKLMASADKLGATNSIISSVNSGIITGTEGRNIMQGTPVSTQKQVATPIEQTKLDSQSQSNIEEISKMLKASMNLTFTVKNDSSSQVGVANGKTQLMNVMPQVQSTKVLSPAYGNR